MSDFDFVSDYAEKEEKSAALDANEAECALNCAFIGIGGGGSKIAKAFWDLGFKRTVLINTTAKDFEKGLADDNYLALEGLDGVGKNVELGIELLEKNSTMIEDVLRTRLGKADWLFVCAAGGGGTGSSVGALNESFQRYLQSVEGVGGVVYVITKPTAQEMLNTAIHTNFHTLVSSLKDETYILLDNERQLSKLRGKVGISDLYPRANTMFAKMFHQILKYAARESDIQAFDSQDLTRFLHAKGRVVIGTAMISPGPNLGADMYQRCVENSPCPGPEGKAEVGVLLEIITPAASNNAEVSGHLEAAASYVGGRSETLFSGIYVQDLPPELQDKLVSVLALGGLAPWAQKTVGGKTSSNRYP
jgi:cell division GTPase FtsZ